MYKKNISTVLKKGSKKEHTISHLFWAPFPSSPHPERFGIKVGVCTKDIGDDMRRGMDPVLEAFVGCKTELGSWDGWTRECRRDW